MINNYNSIIKQNLRLSNINDKGFDIIQNNNLSGIVQKYAIRYAELLNDYIYKNIPTNVLEGMKLKIENELMERTLKGKGGNNE